MRKLLLVTLTALALPASAQAATVSIKPNPETGGKRVQFMAGPGELNQLNANLFERGFNFQDIGKPTFEATPPCVVRTDPYASHPWADCPPEGIDLVDVRLGAEHDYFFYGAMSHPPVPVLVAGGSGNDQATGGRLADRIFGEGGNDQIVGREGGDVLVAGPGDDDVKASGWEFGNDGQRRYVDDNAVDRIWCGTGFDSVTADPSDVVAKDCELVNGEQREITDVLDEPPVPTLDDIPLEVPTILLDIDVDPLAEVLRDGLLVTVGCSATCTITPEVRVSEKLVRRLGLPASVVARSKAVRTKRGKRVRLRFSKAVRRILASQEVVPVVLRVNAVDVDGNPFAVETKLRLRG